MKKNLVILFLSLMFFMSASTPVVAQDIEGATVFYNEAIDLYSQDQVDKSVDFFKRAISLNHDFYEAYYNLAQILMSQDKYTEALAPLQEIFRLKPQDSENLYNLGKVQYKRGYLTNSYDYLKQIPKTAPQYDSAQILISKIDKKHAELGLESKIQNREIHTDEQGKFLGVELANIQAPSGITIDDKGNIYTASFSENVIYKISTDGQKSVYSRSSLIKGPIGITLDKNGNMYVANYSSATIVKITPEDVSSVFAAISKPYCLIYDKTHDRLYISEQNSNKIVKYDL